MSDPKLVRKFEAWVFKCGPECPNHGYDDGGGRVEPWYFCKQYGAKEIKLYGDHVDEDGFPKFCRLKKKEYIFK